MSSHVVRVGLPAGIETANPDFYRKIQDPESIYPFLSDEARFPGGSSPEMIEFAGTAGLAEIASVVQRYKQYGQSMLVAATQSSLTGAATPTGDVILNLSRLDKIDITQAESSYYATVQPGVTIEALQQKLAKQGLFLPSAPTYTEATVIGALSTNAAGARSYKYGSTRNFVEGLKVVLPSGELIDIQRDQYTAHPSNAEFPNGFFELKTAAGESRTVAVPNYTMPDVPKISAGYFAKPGMDLVDLFVGSEGTLGVIAEATVKALPEPATYMAMVSCSNDKQALDLLTELRTHDINKRLSLQPGGISAVEYMGSKAVELVKKYGSIKPPENSAALLFAQVEGTEEDLLAFADICQKHGVDEDNVFPAMPQDRLEKASFIVMREAAPITVNEQIARFKQKDPAITKVGADPCVNPEDIGTMIDIYSEEFAANGIDFVTWGHGEGNLHFNTLPTTADEVERAKQVILSAGKRIITELRGTGTAEHGVGKNIIKQQLLIALYGEQGVDQMRAVKQAFDPTGVMAPGNIFPVSK